MRGIISNMKLLALAALMGCVPVSAQDQPKGVPETRYNFAMFRTTEGYRINAFDDRVLVTFTSYEGGCTGRSYSIRPTAVPAGTDVPSGVLRLTGNVRVTTVDAVVQADEANYHCDTGEIEPLTNVRFKYAPQR